jgi:hypothetical protein
MTKIVSVHWKNGSHQATHSAGEDLTSCLDQAPRLVNPSASVRILHRHSSLWYYTDLDMPFTRRAFSSGNQGLLMKNDDEKQCQKTMELDHPLEPPK